MTFRNATTAINQELGRIVGVQHHAWGIRNPTGERSIFDKPLDFEPWLILGLQRHKKEGFSFELIDSMTMRVINPSGHSIIRTYDDFHDEWENEYVANYYL
jgi:hypothetical protein